MLDSMADGFRIAAYRTKDEGLNIVMVVILLLFININVKWVKCNELCSYIIIHD